jgi:starch synthase
MPVSISHRYKKSTGKTSLIPLKILFVCTEVAPYNKVGGLGDVAWALPRALREMGHDVRVFSPKFGSIDEKKYSFETVMEDLQVPFSPKKKLNCNVKMGLIPGDIPVYLLENQEYYEIRANVYGYADDPRRWLLLSRGSIEFARASGWIPDIIHTNDWMTGFVANDLTSTYKEDAAVNGIATVFSIHNIKYQGLFDNRNVSEMDRDDGKGPLPDFGSSQAMKLNGIRRGIIHSDIVTTVSETYARQILEPEYGEGLERLLLEMRTKLFGVMNGLDDKVFDPANDNDIWEHYSVDKPDGKIVNKLKFQKEFGLNQSTSVPLVGFVGRFDSQKGLDLIIESLEMLLQNTDMQFAVVGGAGAEKYERFFRKMMKAYPGRVGGHLMISKIIGQQVYAASDIFLYPSLYEPCGLAQLIAMRYGSIPVVRKTGGLADTVDAYDPLTKSGTGFLFEQYDAMSFAIQLSMALEAYRHRDSWKELVKRAMSKDFTWGASAVRYEELYRKAIIKRQQWLRKEGIVMAQSPAEVPGQMTFEPLK